MRAFRVAVSMAFSSMAWQNAPMHGGARCEITLAGQRGVGANGVEEIKWSNLANSQ
ncbi:hypothetical protein BH18PSE1_BH18PSE1_06170 [soil metagenome]